MADRNIVAYETDIEDVVTAPSGGSSGHVPVFSGSNPRRIEDGGLSLSDLVSTADLDASVEAATAGLKAAICEEHAVAAYVSDEWAASASYQEGDFCRHGGAGYRCNATHVSGEEFDPEQWDEVLSPEGLGALSEFLTRSSTSGMARLLDIAPAWSGAATYAVGDLVVKESGGAPALQICTVGGGGSGAARFRVATVQEALKWLAESFPTDVSAFNNDAGYITQADVPTDVSAFNNDAGYVTEEDVPTKTSDLTNDSGFITQSDVPTKTSDLTNDSGFITQSDVPTKTSDLTNDSGFITQADVPTDVSELDNDSGFITQADIPTDVSAFNNDAGYVTEEDVPTKTSDLTNDSGFVTEASLPYRIENLAEDTSDGDPTKLRFNLVDRAVNVIAGVNASGNRTIVLSLPSSSGASRSRDFLVMFRNVQTELLDSVSVSVLGASLLNCAGESLYTLYAPSGKRAVYRFTETDAGSVFTVTGLSDPAYQKIRELEQALDDVLADGGTGDFTPGIYLPSGDGLYHRVTAVTDPDTGEVNLGIEQQGVEK